MSGELVREVQELVGRLLCPEEMPEFTDVEEWKNLQMRLATALRELEGMAGRTPEEEGELLLALFMGYSVAVRNPKQVARALERAERVLPLLDNPVMKRQLAESCYREVPDEELFLVL